MRYLAFLLLISGVIWFFNSDSRSSSNYTSSGTASYETEETQDCSELEPDNPYSYGSGHYAGFEWAENNGNGYCSGNSSSFIEGCEEYLRLEELYNDCVITREE
jgi:hypothetical protein